MTARDNLIFLQRWFEKFPRYRNRDLYITGESYAGHYVPQLAQLMVEFNKEAKIFNLKGIAYLGDMWSPGYKRESTLDSRLVNPFRVEGLKEFSGPYNAMVEVPLICRDRRRLKDVEDMLCNYKLILHRVERVDPRKLKNDEKLAFWINVHNAIIMHAHIEHGIPEGNVKRTSLFIKAMCNIGGRSLNAAMIQGYILGCKTHYTGQIGNPVLDFATDFNSRAEFFWSMD